MICSSTNPKSAILISRTLDISVSLTKVTPHHVLCFIDQLDTYVISSYFQYSDDIQLHLLTLNNILDSLITNKGFIIGVDSNAHSPLWFDKRHDARGVSLENFIISRQLNIIGVLKVRTNDVAIQLIYKAEHVMRGDLCQ